MAEVRRQRERRNTALWVLILALVGLTAWGVWALLDGEGAVEVADAPAAPAAPPAAPPPGQLVTTTAVLVDPVAVAGAVRAFAAHVESDMPADPNHLYSAGGISRLGTALAAIVGREPGPDADVVSKANAFLVTAKLLVVSPDSLRLHADWMHAAALAAVDAMEVLARKRFPDAPGLEEELEHARRAAESIRPGRGLAEQRNEVRRFFREANDALHILGEHATTQAMRGA